MRVWKRRRVGATVVGNDWCHVGIWEKGSTTCRAGKRRRDVIKGGDGIRCPWRWWAACPCGPQAKWTIALSLFLSLILSPPRKPFSPNPISMALSPSAKAFHLLLWAFISFSLSSLHSLTISTVYHYCNKLSLSLCWFRAYKDPLNGWDLL